MTRRPAVLGTAVLAGVLLGTQVLAGWLARPEVRPVAAERPATAAPPTAGPGGSAPAPAVPSRAPTAGPPTAGPSGPPPARPPRGTRPARPTTGVFAAGVITRTRGTGVTLTFDDGPSPVHTPQILALLRAQGVRAMFCVVGSQAEAHPELIQQIAREGHQLCNHSWNHELRLGRGTPTQIRANLRRTNDAIRKAVPGAPVTHFRHPGGNWTPAAIQASRELGMVPTGWAVDPRDWARPPAGAIASTVLKGSRRGAIVLMHDGGGDRRNTVAACRTIIPALKQRLRIVPLS
ncbi:polysaccharide deacetylase family protein [Pilimelia terevasa]|uniref:polysaccharide deacetylase family protein n=1 Tax=Pilimelia terevasa TaxID=53372 RepID=UPI0016652636|nr:polysaccharide deacetylase family protein [Pilimelia terevasa]